MLNLTNSKPTLSLSPLAQAKTLVQADFAALDTCIQQSVSSNVELICEIAQYIIESGGKRLRPLLVILSAKALGYTGNDHIKLAAIIEFIHTATLLHDDVVDGSSLRRGLKTANVVWNSQASILVGDFVYSRVFQLITSLQNLTIMQILANATNTIAEGEVLQLINRNNPEADEPYYLEVIRCKTAVLFAAATQAGAVIAQQPEIVQNAMAAYGLHLGLAFQLIDDLLDYSASTEKMGKNIGDDLAEGKPTLPLIYALQHCQTQEAQLIRQAIEKGGLDNLTAIQTAIQTSGAFAYIEDLAKQQITLAKASLANLPDTDYRNALLALADFAGKRDH